MKRVPARQAVSAAKAASKAGNDGVLRGLWMSLYTVWSDLLWKVRVERYVLENGFLSWLVTRWTTPGSTGFVVLPSYRFGEASEL